MVKQLFNAFMKTGDPCFNISFVISSPDCTFVILRPLMAFIIVFLIPSKKEGKDKESIQSRDTIEESDKNTRKHTTQDSQEVSPFPAGDHKAARNRHRV